MSFFVSDSLKGRVTEKQLISDKNTYIESEEEITDLVVTIVSENSVCHKFDFLKLTHNDKEKSILIKVPLSYKFLNQILNKNVEISLKNNFFNVFKHNLVINNFELNKQNERSCYFLKIIIDE